jgi:hypothetical protein
MSYLLGGYRKKCPILSNSGGAPPSGVSKDQAAEAQYSDVNEHAG